MHQTKEKEKNNVEIRENRRGEVCSYKVGKSNQNKDRNENAKSGTRLSNRRNERTHTDKKEKKKRGTDNVQKRKLRDDVQIFKKETKNTEYTNETTGGTRRKRTREESCEYSSRKERICYWCGHEGEEKKTKAPSEWEHMDYQRTLLRIMKQEEE